MAHSFRTAAFLGDSHFTVAVAGDPDALYHLGVAYWTGSDGRDVDLIEAHKWFNLAALNGSDEAQYCRAEIAEAQRQALAWLSEIHRRAA